MEPRRHPVVLLICFALVTNSIFATCPTHTGAPPEEAPHFDLQHYATGDWFGLRNTLYDYGIEITGGYTTEPAGNPVGGLEHGFTYLHNFGFGVLFASGLPPQTNETDIEFNHQIQITPYLYLRPNLQYVIKPNALNRIANALVLGGETGITF